MAEEAEAMANDPEVDPTPRRRRRIENKRSFILNTRERLPNIPSKR